MMTSSLLHLLPPSARRLLTRLSSLPGRAQPRRPRPTRTGAMLAEVLISIFVMGLGVVAVASLFPISVIRSVQATQLTSAAIVRGNAEAVIDILPQMLHNPDGIMNLPYTPPLAYHPINDPAHNGTNYVVDPAGFYKLQTYGVGYDIAFGNTGSPPPAPPASLARFNGGFTAATADGAVTMLDSWIEVVPEAVTDGFSVFPPSAPTTCIMPATADLSTISIGGSNPTSRLVFRGSSTNNEPFRAGHVRTITSISGSTVTFSGSLPPLPPPPPSGPPPYFTPSNVRIETQVSRYTWMLTVKKAPYPAVGSAIPVSPATVDLVVFFNRSYTPDDERIYSTTGLAFDPSRTPANKVLIDPIAGIVLNLKKGSYIFDAVNCLWYRILSYDTSVIPHEVMVDRDVQVSSNKALLMSGIVEVFPLGIKSPRGN